MRQRLAEITGLNGEALGQFARTAAPSVSHDNQGYPEDSYYEAFSGYEDQHYEPDHSHFFEQPAMQQPHWQKDEKRKEYHLSERHYGSFERVFRLPKEVDAEKVHAQFSKGVLQVHLPKRAEAVHPEKVIPVKNGD